MLLVLSLLLLVSIPLTINISILILIIMKIFKSLQDVKGSIQEDIDFLYTYNAILFYIR